jgi:hypothetical protein
MVKEKWLNDKGAYREAFQSLYLDQGDMRDDKFHPGVLTLVN